mmetsp:Transcript_2988/g.6762  ORF Transcript_2988/g.6762 Transcript_2988/m.6762 type:complete len:287 (-) Transcript_2988:333-1193(-)
MPVAHVMPSSSRGLNTASRAASAARFFPVAMPIPSIALPADAITERTSAKSTLMRPACVMISEMPRTPWRSTLSERRKASCSEVSSSVADRSLSFGTMMSASTSSLRRAMLSSACLVRRRPSKLKGVVTMPIVSAPSAREIFATTGADPLPVPPPMPAAMNVKSDPARLSAMSASLSCAANSPSSGSPPVPSPRVTRSPTCRRVGAMLILRACASVLMAMNCAASSPTLRIISLMAFDPPPPHPTTLMHAPKSDTTSAMRFWSLGDWRLNASAAALMVVGGVFSEA